MIDALQSLSTRAWVLIVVVGLGAVTALLLLVGGLATTLLVMAGAALAAAIFLLYSSIMSLTGQSELSLEEALTLVAPSNEEERKRAVLRALKDLEYERRVGKISEEDYAELTTRYRQEAKRLLQAVDEARADQLASAEKRADRFVQEALAAEAVAATEDDDEPDDDEPDDDEPDDDEPDDDEPDDDTGTGRSVAEAEEDDDRP